MGGKGRNKKRRASQIHSSQPLLDAMHRNRVFYHGLPEDYKKLEYPFCVIDNENIQKTKQMFHRVCSSFNTRYCGRNSVAGTEEQLVLQLIELQKTINEIYLQLNEGERVMTDGILGRCTMRHLS